MPQRFFSNLYAYSEELLLFKHYLLDLSRAFSHNANDSDATIAVCVYCDVVVAVSTVDDSTIYTDDFYLCFAFSSYYYIVANGDDVDVVVLLDAIYACSVIEFADCSIQHLTIVGVDEHNDSFAVLDVADSLRDSE